MPTSNNIAGSLSSQQIQQALLQQQSVIEAAQVGAIRENQFVFLAGFDGTRNDRDDVALSGNPQDTNVAQLIKQAEIAQQSNSNIKAQYYYGVGTENAEWGSSGLPTSQAISTAERAYNDFVKAADAWLADDPTHTRSVADITASFTSFSRGYASAAIFSQIIYEKGLVTQDGRVLVGINGVRLH